MKSRTRIRRALLMATFIAGGALTVAVFAQTTSNPFPAPIPTADAVVVGVVDFASLPGSAGPARMMLMTAEPGGRRLFVNDMNGPLYSLAEDGGSLTQYLDLSSSEWGLSIQASGAERGFQSFAFHPQFNERGARGFGRFYTYADTRHTSVPADFMPLGNSVTHDTVLLEWIAIDPMSAVYDGGPPRELLRWRQPFVNHNGGLLAFNPLAGPGDPDDGLLYISAGDGGSGGDPLGHAQNLANGFGKILRIDPLGRSSRNRQYGIPESNPFAHDPGSSRLPEIYAYGVRNPQRFAWDSKTGDLFVADIGQDTIEEISRVTPGVNLGWNIWEGSFRFAGGRVTRQGPRADESVTYPVVEYAHGDRLLLGGTAVTGVVVYRGTAIPQLANLLVFGDNPSGEVFYVEADHLPSGGQDAIRRVLFRDESTARTLLQLIRKRNPGASRADLRFGTGHDDRVFLLNKSDGVIRELVR